MRNSIQITPDEVTVTTEDLYLSVKIKPESDMTISPEFSAFLNTKLTSLEKKLQRLILPLSVLAENEQQTAKSQEPTPESFRGPQEQPTAKSQEPKAKLCKQCGEPFTYTHNRAMYCPKCREIVYKTKNQKHKLKANSQEPIAANSQQPTASIDEVMKEIEAKNKQPYKFND